MITMDKTPEWLKWINSDQISAALSWDRLIPVVAEALAAYSRPKGDREGAVQPLRTSMDISAHNGTFMIMPGYLKKGNALATKLLSLYPNNISTGLPTHIAFIILLDPKTGLPLALMDGNKITELRTAAASVVATQSLLADSAKKEPIIAVLGAGVQAKSHIQAMNHAFTPKEIRIWSRTASSAIKLQTELQQEGINCIVCAEISETVKDADIINTCTLSTEPILKMEWVKNGVHINSVGAPRPSWQELEPDLVKSSKVYADSIESAKNEAGDIIKSGAENDIIAEIGEVLNGEKPPLNNFTTIFKSLGLAVEDTATAKLVYESITTNNIV